MAVCNFGGIIFDELDEIEPQPDNIVLPIGRDAASGNLTGAINLLSINKLFNFSKAMS